MDKWKAIESAPFGTRLLFWWRPIDGNVDAEAVVIGSIPYGGEFKGKWWNDQAGIYQDIWHLTHWMPLPGKPERQTDGGSTELSTEKAEVAIEIKGNLNAPLKAGDHVDVTFTGDTNVDPWATGFVSTGALQSAVLAERERCARIAREAKTAIGIGDYVGFCNHIEERILGGDPGGDSGSGG